MNRSLVAPLFAILCAPFTMGAQNPQPKAIKIVDVTVVDGTDAAPKPAAKETATATPRGGKS